ncbi:MAG: penicillin-binding transpeptidase domain-containing protein [Anaerolineales bacterium]
MKRFLVGALYALVISSLLLTACGRDGEEPPATTGTEGLPDPVQTTEAAPDPDEAARQFLNAWEAGDYAAMYALLSPLTRDGLSLDDFTQRYEEVRRGGAFSSVRAEIVSSLILSSKRAEVRYRVTMESAVVGELVRETRIDLTRDQGQGWGIAWTEAAILPELAEGRQLSLSTVTPTRANIYDRNGDAFASEATADQPNVASLWLVPNEIGDEDAEETMLSTLRRLFDLASTDPIIDRYDPFRGTNFFIPLGVVPAEDYRSVSGLLNSLGGVQGVTYSTRYYYGSGLTPFGGAASPHAVGYVSQIQESELDERRAQGYAGDEYIGRIGIEAAFENQLRGVPGGTLTLLGPDGEFVDTLASRESEPPYAVYTNLDRDLQVVAQRSLEGFAGSIVVLERDTGAVLAMASSPAFDPNLFVGGNPNLRGETLQLLNQANQPYVNRATQGLYPAGSTFKMITMAAALESGEYEPTTTYDCGLEFTELPGITLYDWRFERELPASGVISLIGGLERSCNPWFYHIGLDLYNKGYESAIPDMAVGFGLGSPTGIEIGDEAGQVPSPENSQETLGEDWAPRHPVQLAIGQSALQVTPIQVVRYAAALGNGGTLYRPQLVQRIENAEGVVLQEFEPDAQGELPVSEDTLAAIQQGMINVIQKEGATAYRKFLGLNLNVAGKTGTAQTTEFGEPHAWFAGYSYEGREDLPDIAVVVMVENIGEGSDWAAPIFRRIMETYFRGGPRTPFPWESRLWVRATPEPEDGEENGTPEP